MPPGAVPSVIDRGTSSSRKRADPPHVAVEVARRDLPRVAIGERARHRGREEPHQLSRHRRDRAIRLSRHVRGPRRETPLRRRDGGRSASRARSTSSWPVRCPSSHRLGVPLDLRVDRVAQPESLVSKLVDVLGVELIARRVDIADGFEETERKESINSGKHLRRQEGKERS